MKHIKKRIIGRIIIIILCFVVIAFCSWDLNRRGKQTIPAEEASWTQVRSHGNGEWQEGFEVME